MIPAILHLIAAVITLAASVGVYVLVRKNVRINEEIRALLAEKR